MIVSTLPSLFISHGSPMLALENTPTATFLRGISAKLPKPSAIVIVSAHWETDEPMVTGHLHPGTIHDFQGFSEELYALRYPVPGYPALAKRIQSLLIAEGFKAGVDPARGLDHGAWNPLILMYPQADIPVIEMSVQSGRDAHWHYNIGQALASLRKDNILIIGTGNLTHNLHEAFKSHHTEIPFWVTSFATWVAQCAAEGDIASLLNWQNVAPHARDNHPTPEHFLPFFVVLGAAGVPLYAKRIHEHTSLGVLAMDAYLCGH
jgi:4,5-DOPA dioxygenase extradiol